MQLSLAKAPSLSDWRPLSFLSNYYMQLLGRRQTLCVRLEASLSSTCYIQVLERRHPLGQIGGLFLAYLAIRCNSLWRRHPLGQIGGLSLFYLAARCNSLGRGHPRCQIRSFSLSYLATPYNSEGEGTLSVSDWMPLSLPFATYKS